jgi:hypothetical protein
MEQEALNEMLITKEDLVTHFTETDDTLENFISIAKEAFNEAQAKRDADFLEMLEAFVVEKGESMDKVKSFFTPKVEAKPKKAGKGSTGESKPKDKFYIRYEDDEHEYYAYRTLGGQQNPILRAYLDKNKNKKISNLVIKESELPVGIKEKIEKDPNNVAFVVKAQ